MSQPIIEVNAVTKAFALKTREISLRHEATTQLKRMLRQPITPQTELFYALKDVTFSIESGESVGIIGRNGAGKTTLLRILSRIMRPSSGQVHVRGTYASLIGVGAGFSDTMTGRKNIYLNAAIHGINPQEIENRVADIIAFADIGRYIDMPVKDYSSGMRARLGFSIAVHILPDIVFLDEVLSVGDASFRKKSRERLESLLAQNKTVVFVSHVGQAVTDICERVLWIHDGQLMVDGEAREVVHAYEKFMAQ